MEGKIETDPTGGECRPAIDLLEKEGVLFPQTRQTL